MRAAGDQQNGGAETPGVPGARARVRTDDPVVTAAQNWENLSWPAGPRFLAGVSILATSELIRASNDRSLRTHQLTQSRYNALAALLSSDDGELPLGLLGERLLVHPTSVTSTVDTLERLGLVERIRHPTDRRATLARVTPAGRVAVEESSQAMAADRFGLWALSDRQSTILSRTLAKVRRAAGDMDRTGLGGDPLETAVSSWVNRGWLASSQLLASQSILRVATLIDQSNSRALRAFDLTPSRHEALAVLYFTRLGELPLGKLSKRLLVHPTSVTSTMDIFERLGLAERVPHSVDRRTILARITPKGRRAVETSYRAMVADDFGIGALSDTQARSIFTVLKRVRMQTISQGAERR